MGASQQRLCAVGDIAEGGSRGFLREGNDDQVFAVRQGEEVFVWLNDCPHNHRPLEFRQDRFLSADGQHITCYAHSAHFDIRTGLCFAGPCEGQRLIRVAARVEQGAVWVPQDLPTVFDPN